MSWKKTRQKRLGQNPKTLPAKIETSGQGRSGGQKKVHNPSIEGLQTLRKQPNDELVTILRNETQKSRHKNHMRKISLTINWGNTSLHTEKKSSKMGTEVKAGVSVQVAVKALKRQNKGRGSSIRERKTSRDKSLSTTNSSLCAA